MGKITPEVRAIIEKYQYSRQLRKYADKHFFNDNSFFRRVNSNQYPTIGNNIVIGDQNPI